MRMTSLVAFMCLGASGLAAACGSDSPSAPEEVVNQHGLDFTAFDSVMTADLAANVRKAERSESVVGLRIDTE